MIDDLLTVGENKKFWNNLKIFEVHAHGLLIYVLVIGIDYTAILPRFVLKL